MGSMTVVFPLARMGGVSPLLKYMLQVWYASKACMADAKVAKSLYECAPRLV